MLRLLSSSLRRDASGAVSTFAMGVSLVGGAALAVTTLTAPAHAQNRRQQQQQQEAEVTEQPSYSPEFVALYQPLAEIANAEGGDYAAARGQLDGLYAVAKSPDERNAAGNLTLSLGTKLEDQQLQRRGLEAMLASGKVPAERIGQYQFFVGNLAYSAQDWEAARTALEAAVAAGYTQDNPKGLIAETYFGQGQTAQGLAYLKQTIEQNQAAGQPVPENWLLRGLKLSYDNNMAAQATDFSAMLVKQDPSALNWQRGLQVVNALNSLEPQVHLDLLRLMLATDSMTERNEFTNYIEAADVRVMSNEVQRVLAKGLEKGVYTSSDPYYSELKGLADARAATDRREAPGLASEARSSANGTSAQSAGDVYMSLENYAEAEAMYQLALEKGGVDRDRNLTRLGIAQAQQGKAAEAKATLQQVSGPRAPVATMWAAYADTRA